MRNAAGLANVAAGGVCLAVYLLGALLDDLGGWARASMGLGPIVWIVARWILRREHLRLHRPVPSRSIPAPPAGRRGEDRRWRLAYTALGAGIGVALIGLALLDAMDGTLSPDRRPPILGVAAFSLVVPALIWHHLRSTEELVVGMFLIAQSAAALAGGYYPLGGQQQAPLFAGVVIGLGLKQRIDYRRAVRGGPTVGETIPR